MQGRRRPRPGRGRHRGRLRPERRIRGDREQGGGPAARGRAGPRRVRSRTGQGG